MKLFASLSLVALLILSGLLLEETMDISNQLNDLKKEVKVLKTDVTKINDWV